MRFLRGMDVPTQDEVGVGAGRCHHRQHRKGRHRQRQRYCYGGGREGASARQSPPNRLPQQPAQRDLYAAYQSVKAQDSDSPVCCKGENQVCYEDRHEPRGGPGNYPGEHC